MKNKVYVILAVLFTEIICSQEDLHDKSAKDLYLLDYENLMKLFKNMKLIYSGFMQQKLDVLDTVNQQCKSHIEKVIEDLGKESYSFSSK